MIRYYNLFLIIYVNMGFRIMNSFAPAVRRTQMKFRLTEGAAGAKELPCP